jgi:phosphatidylinositol glycan class B
MNSTTKVSTSKNPDSEPDSPTLSQDNDLHQLVNAQAARDTWNLLLLFRCINAALIWTFFQPDEYFQSLEPAWQMAFGPQSGAWITWVSSLLKDGNAVCLMVYRNGIIN